MSRTNKYSVALAAGLILFFTFGNRTNSTPHTLSTFPYLLSLLPFPLVLYPLLRNQSKTMGAFSVREGIRLGESVVRLSAIAFSLYVAIYSYFFFGGRSFSLVAASFIITLLWTWMIGIAIAGACAWFVRRTATGNGAFPVA